MAHKELDEIINDTKLRLKQLGERPGMYLGRSNLYGVWMLISGYALGMDDAGIRPSPFEGWQSWITIAMP